MKKLFQAIVNFFKPKPKGRANDFGEIVTPPYVEVPKKNPFNHSKPSKYEVKNHVLYRDGKPVMQFQDNHGGTIKPSGIVVHFTSSYNLQNTINFFKSASVSIQLLLGKESGEIAQGSPLNKRCNHAGVSKSPFDKKESLNNHRIGIECVNIGWLKKVGGVFKDCYDRTWSGNVRERKMLGHKFWEPLTEWQEIELIEICSVLALHYNFPVGAIEAHHEVSPNRKPDIGGSLAKGIEGLRADVRERIKELGK